MAGENDSWDDSDNSDGKDAPAMSAEDKKIVDAVKATGIGTDELVGRAARDYKREQTELAEQQGTGSNKGDNSEDAPLSKQETENVARNAAQVQVVAATNQAKFEAFVAHKVASGLGDGVSARRLKSIGNDVAAEMKKNLNLATMSTEQFQDELVKATDLVIKLEMEDARKITGTTEDIEDMAKRLTSQATASNSGKTGGVSHKPSVAGDRDDDEYENSSGTMNLDPDDMTFGMDTEGHITFPTEDQCTAVRDKEMAAFNKKTKAGR